VDAEGSANLTEATAAADVETCDGCWFLDQDADTLWIGLGLGDRSVSFGPAL